MSYGEGTVSEVRPGVWRLRVVHKEKQRSRTVKTAKRSGKREALDKLREFRAELERGEVSYRSETVRELLEQWLKLKSRTLSPNSHRTYDSFINLRINPSIGDVKLKDLTRHRVDIFYAELTDAGLSASSVAMIHAILSGAFSTAVDWEWLTKSPTQKAKRPQIRRRRHDSMPLETLQAILREAQKRDFDKATALALCVLTGCRRGEVCGLQWGDLDVESESLWIRRQVSGDTKTFLEHKVPLMGVGLELLDRYKVVLEERLPGWKPSDKGWLISLDGGETPTKPPTLTAFAKRIGKDLDPPIRFTPHQLRHLTSTQFGKIGVNPRVTADLLGHSTVTETLGTYTDKIPAEMRRGVEHMGAIVAKALEAPALEKETP